MCCKSSVMFGTESKPALQINCAKISFKHLFSKALIHTCTVHDDDDDDDDDYYNDSDDGDDDC